MSMLMKKINIAPKTHCGVWGQKKILTQSMVKWIGLVLMTPKTCDNHGQGTNRQSLKIE